MQAEKVVFMYLEIYASSNDEKQEAIDLKENGGNMWED